MPGILTLIALKFFLTVVAFGGIVFHLMVIKSPETGKRIEQILGTEFGIKKRFALWLETNKMALHERLIQSRPYNIFAILFLLVLLTFLLQS